MIGLRRLKLHTVDCSGAYVVQEQYGEMGLQKRSCGTSSRCMRKNWKSRRSPLTICEGHAHDSAMPLAANWNRFNSCWDTYRYKRPSATWDANNDFARPSMIASGSNRQSE